MVRMMFASLMPKESPPRSVLPKGQRIYAVGDIHGELGLFEKLHEQIREDIRNAPEFDEIKIIYLGDYINRGNQSREILDRLTGNPIKDAEITYLMGNHEFALIKFLTGEMEYGEWIRWGGDVTMLSYGMNVLSPYADEEDIEVLRREFRKVIPVEHYRFLSKLKPYQVEGNYIFVHAGIRPGIPLDEQKLHDLILIRDDFLKKPVGCGKIIIHGHTVFETPHIRKRRGMIDSIGIDTGAYNTGKLTSIVLENNDYRFITAQ